MLFVKNLLDIIYQFLDLVETEVHQLLDQEGTSLTLYSDFRLHDAKLLVQYEPWLYRRLIYQEKIKGRGFLLSLQAPVAGLEPATYGLTIRRSAD